MYDIICVTCSRDWPSCSNLKTLSKTEEINKQNRYNKNSETVTIDKNINKKQKLNKRRTITKLAEFR